VCLALGSSVCASGGQWDAFTPVFETGTKVLLIDTPA
jgi:hypothetical protein